MRVLADFNGLFRTEDGLLLCLSHSDTAKDDKGVEVILLEGMKLTAFEPDVDDQGNPDDLLASGTVIRSPEWLKCNGSKWTLLIDSKGWRHASDTDS
jgi:hypothetical protein